MRSRLLCASRPRRARRRRLRRGDEPAKIETKADFIAAADKICVERDAAQREARRRAARMRTSPQLSGKLAEIYDKAITDLQDVQLPPGAARAGAQKYVQATTAMREPVKRMEAASTDLEAAAKTKRAPSSRPPAQKLQTSVNTVQVLGEVADQAARDYGMKQLRPGRVVEPGLLSQRLGRFEQALEPHARPVVAGHAPARAEALDEDQAVAAALGARAQDRRRARSRGRSRRPRRAGRPPRSRGARRSSSCTPAPPWRTAFVTSSDASTTTSSRSSSPTRPASSAASRRRALARGVRRRRRARACARGRRPAPRSRT